MSDNVKNNKPKLSSEDIFGIVWRACDTFRGTMDPSQYKDYILVMLFLKYVSDLWQDKRDDYAKRYAGDKERVKRAMARERFVVPPEAEFAYLYQRRDAANVGELINIGLEAIEEANKLKLENVFRNIDFNSEAALGQTKERNYRLKHLLDDLKELDLRPSHLVSQDVIGDVYEFLIGKFASDSGKKGGEFYTPAGVFAAARRTAQSENGLTHLRPSLRLRFATDPRRQESARPERRALRPGAQRPDVGALSHEPVPSRDGRGSHRMGRHAAESQARRERQADAV